VPLLKSLACLKGRDNGRRFLIISFVCYLLLVILSPILDEAALLIILLFLSVSPILALASIRRIHDAGFATPFAAITLAIFWLNLFGLTYIDHGAKWTLLFFGFVVTLAMATISNAKVRRNYQYVMGYSGPVILSKTEVEPIARDRIEPTIAGSSAQQKETAINSATAREQNDIYVGQREEHTSPNSSLHANSWEQKFGMWFQENKKLSLIGLSLITLYILVELIFAIWSSEDIEKKDVVDIVPVEEVKQRLNKTEMPDQFWIMHDQYSSVTIAWEGDFKSETDLINKTIYWSATTAQGDKDCTNLHFSLGADIRTIQVTVKNGGDYYADFSPVDSELIIKSIADKDRFKLCGYEFVLKGTRSLLRDNKKYRDYLIME